MKLVRRSGADKQELTLETDIQGAGMDALRRRRSVCQSRGASKTMDGILQGLGSGYGFLEDRASVALKLHAGVAVPLASFWLDVAYLLCGASSR